MRMSDEVRRAYENLDRAIEQVRLAINPEHKHVMGDWAIIVAEHDLEERGIRKTTYSRLFRGGYMSYHVAIGLFGTGLELTEQDGTDDEDE